jgi:hypothetical protein
MILLANLVNELIMQDELNSQVSLGMDSSRLTVEMKH